jgi:TonB family protein
VLAASAVAVPIAALGVDRALDVDIRTVDLPQAVRSSLTAETEPMLPSLRAAAGERDGTATTLPQISDYTTPPLYSDEARRQHLEGVVTIAVRVDEEGRLTSSRVVRGLGAGLDQNALVALRQWRFRPGTRRGTPAAMNAEVDIPFDLRSEAVNELIANDMATLVGPDVTPPRVIRSAGPPLRGGTASGSVVLDVVLLQNGSPKIVRILRSLSPEADESAVRHFEQWRFAPATRNGVPVKVRMNAEVRFHG